MSERMSNERRKWIRSIHAEMQRDEFDGADEIIVECLDEIDALKAEVREKDERIEAAQQRADRATIAASSLEAEVARLREIT